MVGSFRKSRRWRCVIICKVFKTRKLPKKSQLNFSYWTITLLTVDDVVLWWRQWLDVMIEQAVAPEKSVQYREILEPAAVLFNAMMIAGLMLNLVFSVMLARWWQSRIYNPGVFRQEFHALRLPSAMLLPSVLLVALMFVVTEPWQGMFRDILIVFMLMYLFQGVSVVHRYVDKLKLSMAWLVSMYCLLIVLPHMVLFIACLGITDVVVVWRRKNSSKNES